MTKRILLVGVALMIVLAGCSGGPGATTNPSGAANDDGTTQAYAGDGPVSGSSQVGTVQFYISDEKNAIGDFEHLNATVTEVQFHYVGPTNETDEETATTVMETTDSPETTVMETTDSPETTTIVMTAEPEGQEQAKGNDDKGEKGKDKADGKEKEDETADDDGKEKEDETADDDGKEKEDETADDEEGDGEKGQASWITRDLNGTTVDLTELQGENATLLENMSLPAGKYTQVRLVVSEVNGTLKDGSDQRIKLPSGRLKLNKPFTLGANDSVQFVFDITVHEAGKSGKYILKPVAGESGTDQEIERVEAKAGEERGKDRGKDKGN